MKNYRVQVETYDGCVTIWYEKSKAIRACDLILNRVYNQLCGLNIKEINVTPSVWNTLLSYMLVVKSSKKKYKQPIQKMHEKLHLLAILQQRLLVST